MLGIGTLAKKVFGTPNDRKIKATRPLVDTITALEPEYEKLSDEGLVEKPAACNSGHRPEKRWKLCYQKPLPIAVRLPGGPWACAPLTCS